jgi:hypothetical protein
MSKKTFQILSLLLSVLSLLYLILNYFGLIRYVILHRSKTEDYISRYPSLPKADKNRVVVCFTISDIKEFDTIKPFINSILDQTVKVDDIAVTLSYKDIDKIPQQYKKIISGYGYNQDYDNAGNLIFSILREPESDTKIIMVDPHVVYGEDFIETILQSSEKNNDKIIYADKNKNIKYGVLIKPTFFDEKICQYEKGKGCLNWLTDCCNTDSMSINYITNYKSFN